MCIVFQPFYYFEDQLLKAFFADRLTEKVKRNFKRKFSSIGLDAKVKTGPIFHGSAFTHYPQNIFHKYSHFKRCLCVVCVCVCVCVCGCVGVCE